MSIANTFYFTTWCCMSAIDPFSERMYAKLASHSPAPTPARVDARECGLSFEKVADINSSDLAECLLSLVFCHQLNCICVDTVLSGG